MSTKRSRTTPTPPIIDEQDTDYVHVDETGNELKGPRSRRASLKTKTTTTSTTISNDTPTPIDTFSSPISPRATPALIVIFIIAIVGVIFMFQSFPKLSAADSAALRFPRSFADLTSLSVVLKRYRDLHYWQVVAAFSVVYIFLQTFAIPGAIFLSVLAGPLFGVFPGLALVSVVATTGATCCYLLSFYLGRGLVQRCFPALLTKFRSKIAAHRSNLFFYLLFLRVSPLLPNWFISISSPILDIPIQYFIGATFFGLIPANYLHVTTGVTLDSIGYGSGGGVNIRALLTLLGIACLALLPTLFRKNIEQIDSGLGATNTNTNNKQTTTATKTK